MFGYQILSAHRYSTHCEQVRASQYSTASLSRQRVNALYADEEKSAHLDREVAAVDVVAKEQVAGICRVAADLEELHQVELRARGSVRWVSRAGRRLEAKGRGRGRRTYCPWMSPHTAKSTRVSVCVSLSKRGDREERRTGDGRIDLEKVGLLAQQLARLTNDEDGLRDTTGLESARSTRGRGSSTGLVDESAPARR